MLDINNRTRPITEFHAIVAGHAARRVRRSFDGLCRSLGDLEPSWACSLGEVRSEENCNLEAALNPFKAIESHRSLSCRRTTGSRDKSAESSA